MSKLGLVMSKLGLVTSKLGLVKSKVGLEMSNSGLVTFKNLLAVVSILAPGFMDFIKEIFSVSPPNCRDCDKNEFSGRRS